WPERGEAVIQSLGSEMRLFPGEPGRVELLGCAGELKWSQTRQGLKVKLPDTRPCDHAWTLKISPAT
ncbi:alpha-L-fucosidase C-terminal domain-containing protein, partial [Candidatus Latescibacterota bacterium]